MGAAPTVGTPGAIRLPPPDAGTLGQGVAYPLSYNSLGRLNLAYGTTLVEQSLQSIWSTSKWERAMLPRYGAAEGEFEPVDLQRQIARFKQNVRDYEPRVDNVEIDQQLGQNVGEARLLVTYTLRADDTEHTLTFPTFQGP